MTISNLYLFFVQKRNHDPILRMPAEEKTTAGSKGHDEIVSWNRTDEGNFR